jgi:hypothetical protein
MLGDAQIDFAGTSSLLTMGGATSNVAAGGAMSKDSAGGTKFASALLGGRLDWAGMPSGEQHGVAAVLLL